MGRVDRRLRPHPADTGLSRSIGATALGLGVWGALFPEHVKKTFGVPAPTPAVQLAFGARELATGFGLVSDPRRVELLWARVAGDVFDIAALGALDHPGNARRGAVRAALGFVLAVTALDVLAAVRLSRARR